MLKASQLRVCQELANAWGGWAEGVALSLGAPLQVEGLVAGHYGNKGPWCRTRGRAAE